MDIETDNIVVKKYIWLEKLQYLKKFNSVQTYEHYLFVQSYPEMDLLKTTYKKYLVLNKHEGMRWH